MKPIRRKVPNYQDDSDEEELNNYKSNKINNQYQYDNDSDDMNEDEDPIEEDYDEYQDDQDYDSNESEEEQDDDQEEEEEEIKKQLSNVSFSTLLKIKKNGPTTNKHQSISQQQQQRQYNSNNNNNNNNINNSSSSSSNNNNINNSNSKNKFNIKRDNNDAPVEMSAKIPVSRFKQIVPNQKLKVRDPRFDSLSGGKFNEDLFRKRYGFLDDVMKRDIERMEKQYKTLEDGTREKDQLSRMIQSKRSQLKSQQMKDEKRDTRNKLLEKEISQVKKGKAPYHITNKKLKEFELQEKFKRLKESNKLDKYIETKRKRSSHKEKVYLPKRRNISDE